MYAFPFELPKYLKSTPDAFLVLMVVVVVLIVLYLTDAFAKFDQEGENTWHGKQFSIAGVPVPLSEYALYLVAVVPLVLIYHIATQPQTPPADSTPAASVVAPGPKPATAGGHTKTLVSVHKNTKPSSHGTKSHHQHQVVKSTKHAPSSQSH